MNGKNSRFSSIAILLFCLCIPRNPCEAATAVPLIKYISPDGAVVINKGKTAGVRIGDIFEVYRKKVPIGLIQVVEVSTKTSKTKALAKSKPFKPKDSAIKTELKKPVTLSPAAVKKDLVLPIPETALQAFPAPESLTPELEAEEKHTPPSVSSQPEVTAEQAPSPNQQAIPTVQHATETISTERIMVRNEELEQNISKKELKFDLKGYRYYMYRTYDNSGNEQNFLSYNGLLTRGSKIEQGTDLTITTTYGENVKLTGNLFELPLQERSLKFELNAGQYRSLFGEFPAELRSGTLATLNKKISGAQAQYTTKKVQVDWLISQSKSTPKTISFSGDNTHGPFSLNAFQILENSETVKINGQTVSSGGYVMDYYSGQITFCSEKDPTQCTEIKSSDTVQITYEQKMLLSLTGGNITGMSAKYLFDDNNTIGAAHITEKANRAAERIRAASSHSVTGAELLAQTASDSDIYPSASHTIRIPETGTLYPNFRFLDRNFISIKKRDTAGSMKALVYSTDFTISHKGYLYGQIKLLAETIDPGDTYIVSYTYYVQSKDFIGEVHEERLTGNGGELTFYLTESQTGMIYPGSETVYYCTTTNCNPPDAILRSNDEASSGDYEILSDRNQFNLINTLYIPNDGLNHYIKLVSYLTVPDISPTSSEYDHTVSQLFGTAKIGPVAVSYEIGESNADISKTPIQIVKEKVATADTILSCPTSSPPPSDCVFKLKHVDIVESSEIISLSTQDTPLGRGTDYEIQYDTGTLTVTGGRQLTEGTIIYADYLFNPDITAGIKKGHATRLSANTRFKQYNFRINSDTTDTFFSPIGGNNSLETSRLSFGAAGSPTDSFSFSIDSTSYDIARDVMELVSVSSKQFKGEFAYTQDNKSFKYGFGKDSSSDDQPAPDTNSLRKYSTFSFAADNIWRPNLNVEYSLNNEKYSDLTRTVNDTSSLSNKLGLKYKRGNKLSLETVFTGNTIDSSGVTDPYSTKNDTRNIIISYFPFKLVTVSANIDHQRKTDSRPTADASGKDSSAVAITALGMKRIQSATLSFQKQSFPSFTSGGSNISMTTFDFSYLASKSIKITPVLTNSRTNTQTSSTDSSRRSLKVEYRPPGSPLSASSTKEWGENKTTQTTGGPSTLTSDAFYFDAQYKIGNKTDFVYRYNKSEEDSQTQTMSSSQHSFRIGYSPSKKTKYGITYSTTDRQENSPTAGKNLFLESDVYLSKILHWTTHFNLMKYTDSKNTSQNYNGKLFESEFRAEF